MSKRKISKVTEENYSDDDEDISEGEECFIPHSDDSDVDGCINDENSDEDDDIPLSNISYKKISEQYTRTQKKLEENHIFSWIEGEKVYDTKFLQSQILLSEGMKESIR